MEILYFSSGILVVALTYVVAGVFKLKQQVQHLDRGVDDAHRRIDDNTDELYRTLDSRLDKLENRLTKNS
jgi:hypothetical protein